MERKQKVNLRVEEKDYHSMRNLAKEAAKNRKLKQFGRNLNIPMLRISKNSIVYIIVKILGSAGIV